MRLFTNTLPTRRSLAAMATAALVLTGCGTDDEPVEPTPTAQHEDTASPDVEAETTPATPEAGATTEQHTAEPETEPVGEFSTQLQQSEDWPAFGDTQGIYPVSINSAVHDGFERVVIEHAGSGIPSHMAQYTEAPVEPGRGNPIDTGDGAYLEVILSGTASFDEFDEEQMIENGTEITDLNTQAAGTVVSFLPWEATSNYMIGLDEQRPYAVTVLEDPVRIVVDIQLTDQE